MKLKNPKFQAALMAMMSFAGLSSPPIVDGKIQFDEEAATKLRAILAEGEFDKSIEAFNKDLSDSGQTEAIKATVTEMLQGLEIPKEDLEKIIADAKGEGTDDALSMFKAVQTSLTDYKAKQDLLIKKLSSSAEEDLPVDQLTREKMKAAIKHNATHLFASGKEYDAIDSGRGWNKAAAGGLTTSATDFSDKVVINKLNSDAELYFRENPTEINSLHRDNFQLPDFWPKRLGVSDRIASGTILTAEITQGRKFNWLPKNIQEIEAEEGKIYPVQIDAEWEGAQLQEIETSWLNMLNKEGSQPEKMSFVRFLVGELMKRARVEDRISSLNGIFVQTPKDATKGGRFINRQNGLFFQLWKAREIDKKYRAFSMGEITAANVYDYFHSDDEANLGFLKRLPQEVLATTNLVVYIHYKVWTWYKAKYKEVNGTNMDYKGMPEHFEDYPNIRVQTFVDQEAPSFVFATFSDNIEILENVPAEKTSFRFQTLLRKIYLLADYKLGIRLIHIGRQMKEGDPAEFKVQSVWSNDVQIFPEEKFIPVYDKATGIVAVDYKNIQVTEDWKTNITEFTGVKPGQVIKIRGNELMSTAKNVTDGAKISLTGDVAFDLSSGGTLTLLVKTDYTVVELKRTVTAPSNPSTDVDFATGVIDAADGSVFRFTGLVDTTITDINNGVNGNTIRIYGTDAVGIELTIDDVADVVVIGTAVVLAAATEYLELVKVDGIWYKGNTNV